ncbi:MULTISPECIES: succinate dehydrogenase flavoprotein subunit [Shouchella]|uniref:succinate dehydrogenase n=3 Tax=Bacillaceae TaxID=186817 RepID=A0A060LZL8_9BACI|nr:MULTISPECIES: succinate dehydrogenase flavoprotein subunit [Bacillaceae]RQW21037.1 succinate dehydrogenase flavoprotein subunit [Bacillus sp. C1-1]AIC95220.1 succinate dehydrogenase flavoprotein subunit [Shouchella lehensis G1]KQL57545.1 succinate dehydrogenase [Alkalicoccobacillus plakortidis]MBG9783969.1 succinate dehydrogenase [Shouchella lehensis]TES51061.1 succinate dehydrogenase flavoprotein subunit [Shouchella lehensis]
MSKGRIAVVGGGLAGLMAAIKIAEKGVPVDLFSIVPVKRSHSVCAQGGINGAVNTKGEGDSPALHFDDTVYGGDFLANQPPVQAMADAAPSIIHLMDRMGVMFNRTPEGLLDFRRFGGTQHHRTAFAGATTGQQLLYALDEQVRRYEVQGLVTKYEGWEFLSAIIDDGVCRGLTAQELNSAEIRSFPADAVIMATGGPGIIFGKSTNSMINTGYAAAKLYEQGVAYANGEFIQIHPTAIPGDDKLRLMSESARGEGGRVWTYKDGKPWYFLEEKYPAYGNLVPRDIATREIFHVCVDEGLGINGENMVYLDLSHKDPKELDIKLGGIIEIYEKFMGDDPRKVPMKIFPAVHYSMGGMWVDYDQMTNIPGLFAAGECDYSQHGANRLGANSLLSAIYGGMVAGPKALDYINGLDQAAEDLSSSLFEGEVKKEQDKFDSILKMDGKENAYVLHKELGEWMTDNVTVVRYNDKLLKTDEKIQELMERFKNININDTSRWSNQGASFTRQLEGMLNLARVITIGAYNRNESRGAHYKPDFPERNDEEFLKTTKAWYNPATGAPDFEYEEVDTSLIKPRKRDYTQKSKGAEAK